MGVGHDLERQRRERLVVVGLASDLDTFALERGALDGRDVQRRRQVIDDGVEQGLHALVLERGAVQHRDDTVVDATVIADGAAMISTFGDLLFLEVLLHDVLVELGELVHQQLAVLVGLSPGARRDVLLFVGGAEVLLVGGQPARRGPSS